MCFLTYKVIFKTFLLYLFFLSYYSLLGTNHYWVIFLTLLLHFKHPFNLQSASAVFSSI